MNLSNLGEFGLIELLQKSCRATYNASVVKGIGDDAAVLKPGKGTNILFTTDALVEGVHFTKSMSPAAVGHKAIGCNISDIAAMGGCPQFAVVTLGVSPQTKQSTVTQLYAGMIQTAKRYNVAIVGGDMVKSSKMLINVAMIGETIGSQAILRSGAKVGDAILVTGPLGGS
ncbi:MAG: thiamine-phosphate kinase, partial [Candidatus Omnitrophota bacterium]|nr:thiamine-phosphate kinase [Candidatus Omnitrophota bacterium]